MTEYWGQQLEYMKDGMSKLEVYLKQHPNSPSLQKFVDEKREQFKIFRALTARFCTLGTRCETVKLCLIKIKKNSKHEYYDNPIFLTMLKQEEFFFSLTPELMEKIREEEKSSSQQPRYKQLSFDNILPKEDSSNDAKDPH